MVSKELQDKIKAGIVKGNPVEYNRNPDEAYESEDVRRDI